MTENRFKPPATERPRGDGYSLPMPGLFTALTFGSTLLGTRLGLERGALA